MSAKRPRPAIPVLVHVDNPAEVGSVTVDTSTIEEKMNTVINNQERIYDKIPTSGGGGGGSSADLTTVNEKTTALAAAIGPASSTASDDNIFGSVRNLRAAVGDATATPSIDGTDLRSLLYNVREAVGYSSTSPTSSGTSIRNKLATIDTNTTTVKNIIGTNNGVYTDNTLIGATRNLVATMGKFGTQMDVDDTTIRGFLYNMRNAIGSVSSPPATTGSTVRDLLTAIKENTASGGGGGSADLTTVNEKITALAETIGPVNSTYEIGNLLGRIKNISRSVGDYNVPLSLTDTDVRSILYNLRTAIGSGSGTPTLTGTSVRDLLTQIKENTASGGGGGSADLTTVNEKTTALAAAIGSASDDSSTVSVIGLLKSITDKY